MTDNIGPHTSAQKTSDIQRLGLTVLDRTPHSSELSLCDLNLFLKLKDYMTGDDFLSANEINTTANGVNKTHCSILMALR